MFRPGPVTYLLRGLRHDILPVCLDVMFSTLGLRAGSLYGVLTVLELHCVEQAGLP